MSELPERLMKCGHPLAARRIAVVKDRIKTTCWACEVERKIRA